MKITDNSPTDALGVALIVVTWTTLFLVWYFESLKI